MFGKGSVIVVLGLGIVFGIIIQRLTLMNNRAIDNMAYYHDVTKSHSLASTGANVGMAKLYQDTTLRGLITSQSFSSGYFNGGSFTVRVDSTGANQLRLRSVSTFKSYTDTVEVYCDKHPLQSFSMFAWMTNDENGVYWITKDTVWGRVHSNGTLNISGTPVFMDKVTTAKSISPKPGTNGSNGIYKKGYETGVAPITLPTDISAIANAATSGGHKYTQTVYVTLSGGTGSSGDGKVYVRKTSFTGTIIDSVSLSDASFNGVIYSTSDVHVKGTVDGKLTIGTNTDIYVSDNVYYEKNPLTTTSDDMLGLVANSDVFVEDNTANHSNVEIDAAIFARSGSFQAQDLSSLPVCGTLTLVGSIVQGTRGAVSLFSGNTILNGYSKRYYYDPRFADPNVRPPDYPGFYRQTLGITNWWESVRIPDIHSANTPF